MSIPDESLLLKINKGAIEPNTSDFENQYLALFKTFLCNTKEERQRLSNTIEFWDSIPRYSVTRRQQNTLRDEKTGMLPTYITQFCYKGETFRIEIVPARLNAFDEKGNRMFDQKNMPLTVDYYPSNREELVEAALRKIATRHSSGFMRDKSSDANDVVFSGVMFSLYELMTELADTGHTFSYLQLTESLNILNSSQIKIYKEDAKKKETGLVSSNYLPVLAAVTRDHYLADSSSKWMIHFHPFVTQGILMLAYRQYNYKLMMGLSSQLCRWIHKYICIKFTQASLIGSPFEIHYKTIKRDSGLLARKRERANFTDIEEALNELKAKGVLSEWTKAEVLGTRGKKLDTIYRLSPSIEFIRETKAANKRKGDAVESEAGNLKKAANRISQQS